MKRVYLEQRGSTGDVEHNKFFEITDDGKTVNSRWGAVGAKGQQKVLAVSDDPAVRQAAWDKKFNEKTRRKDNPYVVIEAAHNGQVVKIENRPSSEGRRWGLEVETHSNLSVTEIAGKMRERNLEVKVDTGRYFHSTGAVWDVKRDGSCGYEFASPILSGEAGIFDAKIAVEKIREVCPTAVNSKCGIHVTIDISDFTGPELVKLMIAYLKAQEHFYAECNESRQNNHYCKRNPTDRLAEMIRLSWNNGTPQEVADLMGGWRNHDNRYHGLNLTRMFSIKVIEFRMLESTVAIRKVGAWIKMCVGFVDGIKKSKIKFRTTEPFGKETFDKIVAGTWSII